MLVDQKTEEVIVPLNEFLSGGRLELANSECSFVYARFIQLTASRRLVERIRCTGCEFSHHLFGLWRR